MSRKKVKVQADLAHADKGEMMAQKLKDAGMVIEDEYLLLGHFRGVVESNDIDRLKHIPGVAFVDVIGDEGAEERNDYSISGENK